MPGCCALCISPRPITLTIMKASPAKNDGSRVACVVLEFTGIPTYYTWASEKIKEREGRTNERESGCVCAYVTYVCAVRARAFGSDKT